MAAIQGQQQQEIGERIRQHRKKKKLNQTQLGELLGIGTKAVSDYEKGKIKVIPFEKRVKLSKALNVPITNLLYENEKIGQYCCELCRYYGGGDELECAHCDPMDLGGIPK